MTLPALQTLRAIDAQLQRVQDNVANALRPVLGKPILDGLLHTSVLVAPGSVTMLQHGLPRALQGWIICDTTGAARVWRTSATVSFSILPLTADAVTTLTVWVF